MNIHIWRFLPGLLMVFGATALAEEPRPSWGGDAKSAPPANATRQTTGPGQAGIRPPPPPPAQSSPSSSASAPLPPRPPGVGIQTYDPLDMWVNFRSIQIGWDFTNVGIGGKDRDIALSEDSQANVIFWGPAPKYELPKGPYTVGVVLYTNGVPFDGLIQIVQYTGTVDAPLVKECPVAAGLVTCIGSAVLSPQTKNTLRIQLKRHQGSRASYNLPVVKKILIDVPI